MKVLPKGRCEDEKGHDRGVGYYNPVKLDGFNGR